MPAHSATAGSIILEEAYALGKMLDNSGWNGLLRPGVTPSDIDHPRVPFVLDNKGSVLFAELSNNCDDWNRLARTLGGQRWAYESIIKGTPHCAVMCRHHVSPEDHRKIDTLRDIDSFQVMVWDFGPVLSPICDGSRWQHFVCQWVNKPRGPIRTRRHILGLSVGLIQASVATATPT